MSNVPPAHNPSPTEMSLRRGVPSPVPDRPSSSSEQGVQPHPGDNPETARSADELRDTLAGWAAPPSATPAGIPHAGRTRGGRALRQSADRPASPLTAEQRLLLLDTWQRSGLPAGDFAALVGVSKHTLYAWKRRFDTQGPAGLLDQPRGGPSGSKLPDLTKRTILLRKQANPDFRC